jgi:predicted P-loop ATPase
MSVLTQQLAELRRRVNATGDPNAPIPKPAWFRRLRLDLAGAPERNEANVIVALTSDPAFAGVLAFDEFGQEIVVRQPLPWDDGTASLPRPWEDADDIRTAEWLQLRGINVAPVVVSRAVGAVARELRIHPVRDWLDTLTWDGTPRIETWTSAYLGAEPTAFHHTIGALWLISAVARIYRPGVKADHMLILEGPQGARKSTAIKVLAGEEWFTDELPELGSKDAALHMQGVWIVEIAELDAIGRAEVSRIKAFLTRTTDRFRPPYGRYTVEVPRQCVFAGTVNPDTYLRDETGNRRFWPLRCGTIDIAALARDRDQLWAEAVHRFRAGAIWWIDDPALLAEAREEQDRRYQSDAWDDLIEHWLTHEIRTVSDGFPDYGNSRTESVPRRSRCGTCRSARSSRRRSGSNPPAGPAATRCASRPTSRRTAGSGTGGATRAGARRRGSGGIEGPKRLLRLADERIVPCLAGRIPARDHRARWNLERLAICAVGSRPHSDLIVALIVCLRTRLDWTEREHRPADPFEQRRQRWSHVVANAPEEHATILSSLLLLASQDCFEILPSFGTEPRPAKRPRQRHDHLPLGFVHYSCIFIFMQDLREALGDFMRERGYTQSEAARALGVSQPSISRALKRGSTGLVQRPRRFAKVCWRRLLPRSPPSLILNIHLFRMNGLD